MAKCGNAKLVITYILRTSICSVKTLFEQILKIFFRFVIYGTFQILTAFSCVLYLVVHSIHRFITVFCETYC